MGVFGARGVANGIPESKWDVLRRKVLTYLRFTNELKARVPEADDEKTYNPKKINRPSAAPISKGHSYNAENSGDEKTPEKGARIAGLVAKLQKSGLKIEQIVNAKHAARQMRFVASKPTMNFSGSARDGEERPFPGQTAAYSDVTRQIDANGLPSNAVHSSKKLRALGTKLRALQAKENKLLDEDENADTDSVVAAMTLVQADI